MRALIVATVFFIQGCSSLTYNYTPFVNKFSIPEVNTVTEKGIGEPLLDQGLAVERDILVIKTEGSIVAYKIKPGSLLKVGEDELSVYYVQNFINGISIYSGLILSTPDALASVKYLKGSDEYCIMRPVDITVCGKLDAKREKEKIVTGDSFRRTLIYSGRVGNKLRISYREFNSDMARMAFNTDVEYDLNESNIIGYSGSKIEVLEATNTKIKYKVINYFNVK